MDVRPIVLAFCDLGTSGASRAQVSGKELPCAKVVCAKVFVRGTDFRFVDRVLGLGNVVSDFVAFDEGRGSFIGSGRLELGKLEGIGLKDDAAGADTAADDRPSTESPLGAHSGKNRSSDCDSL